MLKKSVKPDEAPGVGPTDELSLRVSTAVLTKTTFRHPESGQQMLVLERKAVVENKPEGLSEKLIAQPLGGASRLNRPDALLKLVGSFNYDSEESAKEQDFRIQVRPRDWREVKSFCVRHFLDSSTGVIEADPRRELAEELSDSLKIEVSDSDYTSSNMGIVLPSSTLSIRAGVSGQQTVRAFNVYHVEITDGKLIEAIMVSSDSTSNEDIMSKARDKAISNGKKGKASALIAIPLSDIVDLHAKNTPENRWSFTHFNGLKLGDNVPAILCEELPDVDVLR